MEKNTQSKARIALSKLTPSRHGRGTTMPVDEWIKTLKKDGYLKVPVYHSTAARPEEFKSQKVRKALLTKVKQLFYHHATDTGGFRYLIIALTDSTFKELGWTFTEAVAEEV